MPEHTTPPQFEQRLRELEARVAELEEALKQERLPLQRQASAPKSPGRMPWDALVDSGEGWLARVGVGLLVVGLILLFRYAAEQGWLTPELRILIGALLGGALLAGGVFLFHERRLYRQILAGGGITILFITTLAAAELYRLISLPIALLILALIAALAFFIAARQEESIIATVGSVGALLPPAFLLEDRERGLLLWLYLTLVIAGSGLLFARRRWHRAHALAAVISVAALFHPAPLQPNVQLAALAACAVCWIAYAALPLLSPIVRQPASQKPDWLLVVMPAVVTMALAGVVEAFIVRDARGFEIAAFAGAAGLAVIAWGVRRWPHAYGAAVIACTAALAAGSIAAFGHPRFYIAIAMLATSALWAHERIGAPWLRPFAHVLFAGLAAAFVPVIAAFTTRPPFDEYATAYLLVTAIALFALARLDERNEQLGYFVGIYIVTHVLLASELGNVAAAPWLASAAYGILGSALLITGLLGQELVLQRAGMLSLALLVARLFLYDMANVDVAVRIVLFLVIGFAFLALSYLVRSRRFGRPS